MRRRRLVIFFNSLLSFNVAVSVSVVNNFQVKKERKNKKLYTRALSSRERCKESLKRKEKKVLLTAAVASIVKSYTKRPATPPTTFYNHPTEWDYSLEVQSLFYYHLININNGLGPPSPSLHPSILLFYFSTSSTK